MENGCNAYIDIWFSMKTFHQCPGKVQIFVIFSNLLRFFFHLPFIPFPLFFLLNRQQKNYSLLIFDPSTAHLFGFIHSEFVQNKYHCVNKHDLKRASSQILAAAPFLLFGWIDEWMNERKNRYDRPLESFWPNFLVIGSFSVQNCGNSNDPYRYWNESEALVDRWYLFFIDEITWKRMSTHFHLFSLNTTND